MMKKIFGMAAVSALVFGMFACSDGEDGINGKNGADGADGVSCAVKALKDGSGFKVLCDGDSVGVLLNADDGKDGKKGADGKNGSDGEDGNDGKDGIDGKDAKAVDGKDGSKGADGTGCSAKENKAKNGYDIVCDGTTVGTVTNGNPGTATDGDDGEPCSLEEGEDGAVTVSCDGKSAILFNHTCGTVGYDPATQFCYERTTANPRVGVRCKYKDTDTDPEANHLADDYDPEISFCDENDTLRTLCEVAKEDGKTEKVPYVYGTHYCDVTKKKVVAYIPCAPGSDVKRRETQYCYTTKNAKGIQVADMLECSVGAGMALFNPRTNYCKVNSGTANTGKRLICGDDAAQKDTLNIDIRYNEAAFNGNGEICDARKGQYHVYKYVKIGTQTWMAQNLNYRYIQPTKGFGTGEGIGLDSSSFCYDNDPANCDKYGRLYLYSAIVDSAALEPDITCGAGTYCNFTEKVQGLCPDGWHLPTETEYGTLRSFAGTDAKKYLSVENGGTDDYGFSAIHVGYRTNKGAYAGLGSLVRYYTVTDAAGFGATKFSVGTTTASMNTNNDKAFGEPVRCIKD